MLDYKRLESNRLLRASGWTPYHKGLFQKHLSHLHKNFPPQVPPNAMFERAGLGVGPSCAAIEFDFFHYDASVYPELEAVCRQIGKPAVYIGIGYDILGDWLIDETGVVYFQNQIQKTLTPFSQNIYDFLEKDIYRCADLFQKI